MKILIIPDKFKGSLSSEQAAEIIASGLKEGYITLTGKSDTLFTQIQPMADGGEGTLEVIAGGDLHECLNRDINVIWINADDPLGRKISVPYIIRGDVAYIEMARISGLQLLGRNEYNPLNASTYGLGEVIVDALKKGAEEIIVGIGGSATNDGGMGMLRALGYKFVNNLGDEVFGIGEVAYIKKSETAVLYENVRFTVVSDVSNPLLGEKGASRVYSPQKGAGREMVNRLESDMEHYATLCEDYTGKRFRDLPGAGAAGGTGFAFMTFLNAHIEPGWKYLFKTADVRRKIEDCDLVITGEGNVDSQSFSGKLLSGVSTIAREYGKRLWVFCGDSQIDLDTIKNAGIEKLFRLTELAPNKYTAIFEAERYLKKISIESATFL